MPIKFKAFKKLNPQKLMYFLAFLCGVTFVLVFLNKFARKPVSAAWFDESFAYRQTISFTSGSAYASETRVSISVNTSALIAASKMLSTCADTRFTDSNGKNLKYQLTGTCNNAATTYDVVFPIIVASNNTGYFYYGNPNASSQSQNVSNITSLGGGATNGGPVKIDDASNFSQRANNGRQIVRTSDGTLYAGMYDSVNSKCEIWKSTDSGSTWVQKDAAGTPTCNSNTMGIAYSQASGTIVMTYTDASDFQYLYDVAFSISTDTFGTPGTVNSVEFVYSSVSIAVDNSGYARIAYNYYDDFFGRCYTKYRGATNVAVTNVIASCSHINLSFTNSNRPVISYINENANSLQILVATTTAATVFTTTTVDSTPTASSSFHTDMVRSGESTWLMYIDETGASDYMSLASNLNGNVSGTWTTGISTGIVPSSETQISTVAVGSNVYIFYVNSVDDIAYNVYDGTSWSGETTLQTGTFSYINAKWALYDDIQQSTQIDYVYTDGTDTYWASLSLAESGPTVTLSNEELGPGPLLWWSFAEGYGSTTNDSTIQNNDGTITNAQWRSNEYCISDNCLYFDGSGDHVSKTYSSDTELNVSSSSFSLGLWFKHSSTISGTDNLVSRASGTLGSEVGYKIYMNSSGYMCFGIDATAGSFPSDSACSTTSYADSTWHHLMAVKTGTSSVTLFIDGRQIATDTSIASGSLSATDPVFRVGIDSDGSSNGWDGFVDEVKYFNFAKTSGQVLTENASRGVAKGTVAQFGNTNTTSIHDGLVAYWSMNETSWATNCSTASITDVSGNGLHGLPCPNASAVALGSGKFGNGGVFDGSNDYIGVTDNTALRLTAPMTVSLWFSTSANITTGKGLLRKDTTTGTRYLYGLDFGNGSANKVSAEYYNGGNTTNHVVFSQNTLNDGNWHHAVMVIERSTMYLYIDGVLQGTTPITGTMGPPTGELNIGANPPETGGGRTGYFTGKIDEARIYNKALSESDVKNLYNWAPGPVGWWKMDEQSGTMAYDTSSNGNNGNLGAGDSAPAWTKGKYGTALQFDGVNDYINAASTSALDDLTTITMAAWIKPSATSNYYQIVDKSPDAGPGGGWVWQINMANNSLEFWASCNGSPLIRTANNVITANTWQHVAVSWSRSCTASTVTFYINGVIPTYTTTTNGSSITADAAYDIYIGMAANGGDPFMGTIDDVKMYNYRRNQSQIIEDMNGGHPLGGSPIASQTVYWNFDEMYGTTTNNTNTAQSSIVGTLGTGNSNPSWQQTSLCKINACLYFDVSEDNIDAGDISFVDSLTQMTISFWINPLTLATNRAIISKNASSQKNFAVVTDASSSSEIRVHIAASTGEADNTTYFTTSGLSLTASSWQHITIVYDGTNPTAASRVAVYRNGKPVSGSATGTLPASMTSGSTSALRVGDDVSSTYLALVSRMDEMKIYSASLTQAEVLIDYNGGANTAFGAGQNAQTNEGFIGTGPIAYFKFDEKTGINTYDYSGNLYVGSFQGNATWTKGKNQTGITFDGSGDFISTNVTVDLSAPFAFSFWTYPRTLSTDDTWISKISGVFSIYYSASSTITICMEGACANTANSNPSVVIANKWNHIVVTYSGTPNTNGALRIYVNGVDQTSDSNIAEESFITDYLRIGTYNEVAANSVNGVIDELKVYNYNLTPAQVAYEYNRGAPVAHYQFDEGSGVTLYNNAIGADGLALGLHGTLDVGVTDQVSIGDINTNESTPWYSGRIGKVNSSLNFDGTDDYVAVTDSGTTSPLDFFNGQEITISAWFNPDILPSAGTYRTIVTKGDVDDVGSDLNYNIRLGRDSGTNNILISMCYTNTSDSYHCYSTPTTTSLPISIGTWYHVAFTYTFGTASTAKMYFNGNIQQNSTWSSGTGNDAPNVTNEALWIGADNLANGDAVEEVFMGRIDEVRIYRYTLTQSQIQNVMNGGSSIKFGPATGSP